MPGTVHASAQAIALAIKIEAGMPFIREDQNVFLDRSKMVYYGCPLGMALVGQVGDAAEAHSIFTEAQDGRARSIAIANILGIPFDLVQAISGQHLAGIPAIRIIENLRTGDYDKHCAT